ncbi:MAG: D-alanine--D-alanine ligase [Candidatus Eisenbacteria sp.]|nr:D-alanine--D-alanine ligase [Candidatus Eisenbacteria bacterium]
MRKLRVLTLVAEGLEPPATVVGLSDDELAAAAWKTEYDVVVTLEDLGHRVHTIGVHSDLATIRTAIEEFRPHIAFNLLEEFGGLAIFDQHVVNYLELTRLPYTGCNPRGLMIARDKALSKKLLTYHRIPVPAFAVFRVGRRVRRPRNLHFPLFVKSAVEDASLGISRASLVHDNESLEKRVAFVHEHVRTDAIAEEFIDGRELYVGMTGNHRLEVFPIWELVFENLDDGTPLIATGHAKWNPKFQRKWGVTSRAAEGLPDGLVRRIYQRCRRIYRILGLSGYARIDFRLAADGSLFFLEANPNPALAYGEDFSESAETKGVAYDQLIQRIVNLGMRWDPTRRAR